MNNKVLCALVVTLAIPCVAQANDSGFFAGAGLNFLTAKSDDGEDLDNTILELKGGYKVNPYFMVDARYGFPIKDESDSENDGGYAFKGH